MHAFGAAGLHRSRQSQLRQRLADQLGGLDDHREGRALGRIEVEHQIVRTIRVVDPEEGDVVLHRTLIGEPQQRATVVAECVGDLAARSLGPDRHSSVPSPVCTRGDSSA